MMKTALLAGLAILSLASLAHAYFPPKGVPRPLWGALDPINEVTPPQPGGWPGAEVANFYYIDPDHGSATDTANTYGYPNQPRLTLPSAPAAGSVIFVESFSGPLSASNWTGTEANPIWLIGTGGATVSMGSGETGIDINNSDYILVDGITFDGSNGVTGAGNANKGFVIRDGADHVCVRNCVVQNTVSNGAGNGFTSINTLSPSNNPVSDVVLYGVTVRDCHGGAEVGYETGGHAFHSFGDSGGVHSITGVWILKCAVDNIGEDGVQLGQTAAGSNRLLCSGFWIADSVFSRCWENAIDLKACDDIVIVENDAWGFAAGTGSDGTAIVLNNDGGGPTDAWIIRNKVHDCRTGVRIQSATGVVHIIGNTFYDINRTTGELPPDGAGDNGGVAVWQNTGAVDCVLVNNTLYDVEGGAYYLNVKDITIHNNVFLDLHDHTEGSDYVKLNNTGVETLSANWAYDPDGVSGVPVSGFTEADPLLISPQAREFGLLVGSPCIGAGTEHAAYDAYATAFGESIEYDFDERIRDGWDVGAFEYVAGLETKLGLGIGERMIFGGDSITAASMYSHYLISWFQLMYPDLNLKTHEHGRSGTQIGGWATPDTTPPATSLYEGLAYPYTPDVIFMMHGQNGGETPAVHEGHYSDLWTTWVNGTDAAKLVILGMHPVQAATDTKSAEAKANGEETLAGTSANMFHSHTFRWMGAEWLANSGNGIDVQRTNTEPFSAAGQLNVHPDPGGHLVIAAATLMGLEAEKAVSAVAIDAAAGAELESYRSSLTGLVASSTSVSFNRLDESLPWSFDEIGRANATTLYRKVPLSQRYTLRVAGLDTGTYKLEIGGVEIGQWTAAQLNNGINLANLTEGPIWDQGQEVLGEIRELMAHDRTNGDALPGNANSGTSGNLEDFHTALYVNGNERGATYKTNQANQVTDQDAYLGELHADAEPVSRAWVITQVSAPPPAGAVISTGSFTVGP